MPWLHLGRGEGATANLAMVTVTLSDLTVGRKTNGLAAVATEVLLLVAHLSIAARR
jgi:hypothetical protein